MSDIEIRRVTTRRLLRTFIKFPFMIYRNPWDDRYRFPFWVPPLHSGERKDLTPKKNNWFLQGEQENFLAYRSGLPVGRISVCIDHGYIHYTKDQTAFFGYFECQKDPGVARELLAAAEEWSRNRGFTAITGPVNQSPNGMFGTQVMGFDRESVIFVPWNPPYYPELIEGSGYQKHKDFLSYFAGADLGLSPKIQRVAELCRRREGVRVRPIDMKRELSEVSEDIRDIYNASWAERWGFVPWTRDQFHQLAKDLRHIIDPDLVLVAEFQNEIVGFALPIPDMNHLFSRINGRLLPMGWLHLLSGKKSIETLRVVAFGLREAWRHRGVEALLISELYSRGKTKNYFSGDFSGVLSGQYELINLLENWGATHYKTHRLYRKELP